MRNHWLKSLYRNWGLDKLVRRPLRSLKFETLEDRLTPTVAVFQQGLPILVDAVPGATYTGAIQLQIDNQTPTTNKSGSTNNTYFIDGTIAGTLGSANQQDLIRFGNLFVGEAGGVIPVGSIIKSATLRYVTAPSNETTNSPTNSVIAVSQMLTPFSTTSTWASLGMSPANAEATRGGPTIGIQTERPNSTIRNGDPTALGNAGAKATPPAPSLMLLAANTPTVPPAASAQAGLPTLVDITAIVQDWANDPTRNLGLVARQAGDDDGWAPRSIGHPFTADRPMLTIEYEAPPVAPLKTASFQQGVNGYTGTSSVWLQGVGAPSANTTTDGSTILTPVYLDGYTIGQANSGDDQMLIRFDRMFGNGPGQIPVGSTIVSASFEITTAGTADLSAAQANGFYMASQVLVDWDLNTHYQDTVPWGGDGPSTSTSKQPIIPIIGDTTTELKVLSYVGPMSNDQLVKFDITAAVAAWAADPSQNKGINIQAGGCDDGWGVNFPGSVYVSSRPRLTVKYTLPASPEPANNSLNLDTGTLTYIGGTAIANALQVEQTSGTYTITDSSGAITLNQTAKDAGWSGSGTNVVTGPSSSITGTFGINTGSGNDVITLKGAFNQMSVDAGGDAGDTVAIDGTLTTGGGLFSIIGANTITATPGSLIDAGSAGLITLAAKDAIGTSTNPIPTKAFGVGINAGNGGAFITESDGAYISGNVTGTGTVTVNNLAGKLSVAPNEILRTAQGAITLSSADDIAIDGTLGVSAGTGAGLITINANTDGADAQGYNAGPRSNITTSGDVTINVNTASAGTGNAGLGVTNIGGTFTVTANAGNILWATGTTIGVEASDFTILSSTAAKHYVFTVTGAGSSIGTATRPIQASNTGLTDAVGSTTVTLSAGGGGIYYTAWGPIDVTIAGASTTNGGTIRIVTANYGTATTATTNTHNLFVDGTVTSDTGNITLISNDDLTLTGKALIGGPGYSGTVLLRANDDAQFTQRLLFEAGSAIVTSNASASAVILRSNGNDATATDAISSGITLGNVTTGDGGTITVINDGTLTGTALYSSGNITQLAGTVLNTGTGTVNLTGRSRLNAATTLPPSAGIGTSVAPIQITASKLVVNATNSPVNVLGSTTMTITASAIGRTSTSNTTEAAIPAVLMNIGTSAGQLIVGGLTQTDTGTLTLTSTGVGGGIVVNAPLGDATTGNTTLNAGTNTITFTTAYTTFAGKTTTISSGSPANLGPSTVNNGTMSASSGLAVSIGESFSGSGSILTGTLTVNSKGSFIPATTTSTAVVVTRNLQLNSGGIFSVNLNGTTAGTGHDQANVTGTVAITDSLLRINVPISGLSVGNTFTIISNDGSDAVTGTFAGGTTIRAFNNPLYTFTLNYAGGDGNDVVATLTDINPASALLDVQGTDVLFYSNVGKDNSVAVTRNATHFFVTESLAGATISLTAAAVTAGWTGGGTNQVTGPFAGVTGLTLGLSDGNDTVTGIDAGSASITLTGAGTLTVPSGKALTTTGSFTFDEYTAWLHDGSVSAGTGASFTGLGSLIFSGSGSLSTTSGSITATRFGDFSLSGPTLGAAAGSISITGTPSTTTILNGSTAVTPTFTVSDSKSVSVTGVNSTSGGLSVTAIADITETAPGRLGATTLTLTAPAIGAAGNPVLTKATTIVATAADGGVFLSELDGATATLTATGAGAIDMANTAGLLTLSGAISTGSGAISLASGDGITLTGTLNTSGNISIQANTDGAGSEGYFHTFGSKITTTSVDGQAFALTVNTPSGGTGNAVLGVATVGSTTGGVLNVTTFKGSILWNPDYGTVSGGTLPNTEGGANNGIINAYSIILITADDITGGSIGTIDTPIQAGTMAATNNAAGNSFVTLTAGSGGIYYTDWLPIDPTIANATAQSGDIQLFAANADDSRFFFASGAKVFTGNGNIWIKTDDNMHLEGAQIGGPTFGGTIRLDANRDAANEQRILMDGLSLVQTTNAGPNAILMTTSSTDNNPSNVTLGGVTLGTVITGSGGTLTINTAPFTDKQGNINQIRGTVVDVGEGTLNFNVRNLSQGVLIGAFAGVYSDLDGTGANRLALQVRAKTVQITSHNTDIWLAETSSGDPVVPNDGFTANGFEIKAALTGLGYLKARTSDGKLTVFGPTNTDGNELTLQANGVGGGIVVNGVLADANTGTVTLDAAGSDITFNSAFATPNGKNAEFIAANPVALGPTTTITTGTTILAANGLTAGSGDTLTGFGTADTQLAATTVAANAVLAPGSSPGTITTGNLVLAGTYAIDVNGTGAGQFDQTNVIGSVDITGAKLGITVSGNLSLNDTFTIIDNDQTGDAVVGSFVGGPNYTSLNDPRYIFTVNTAGGDGNDVVLKVSQVFSNVLHVTPAGQIQFATDAGINDVISVNISGGKYVVTDTATPITLTAGASTAGWTGNGTNTVQGPVAGVTGLAMNTSTGNDVIGTFNVGVPTTINSLGTLKFTGAGGAILGSLGITGPSTLAVESPILATDTVSVSSVTNITGTASGTLGGTTVTLTPTNAIGTLANPVNTKADVLILAGGNGGVFVNEADGANVVATATGPGTVSVLNVKGTLTFDAPVTTGSGDINLVSADDLIVNTEIGAAAFTGTITIAANTDGLGTQGYEQTTRGNLLTANNSAKAVSLTVNTGGGGTGDAILGVATVGSAAGGTYSVNTNGGSALWNSNLSLPATPDTGNNIVTINARDFIFAASGAGSIGSLARPLQTQSFAFLDAVNESTAKMTAGSGGAFLWNWGANDITVTGATATGAGDIQIVAANAGGHNLWVRDIVSTGSGHIDLWSNDDLFVESGAVIGGPGFSGTVFVSGNRDKGTAGQTMLFDSTASISTSNNSASAVAIQMYGDAGVPSQVTLSNITVGDGGTIAVDVTPQAESGRIIVQPGTVLNAGVTGTVSLVAGLTTGAGDIIGTSVDPLSTNAGTVSFSGALGDVWITEADGANVTGAHTGAGGNVRLNSTTGALSVPGTLATDSATLTFNAAGGVVVSGTLGDANTGAIAINGPLTGTGTIAMGTGGLSVNQTTSSTFAGDITGSTNFVNQSTGTLTLSGSIGLTGTVTGKNGTTLVTGALTAPTNVSSASTGTIGGTGTINSPVTTAGVLSPGIAGVGTISTGALTFIANGVLAVDLLGDLPANADRVVVTGAVNLSGAKISVNAPNTITPFSQFIIIDNDGVDGVAGTFQGYNEGDIVVVGTQGFSVSYIGGDGNDVTLTATDAIPPLLNVAPGGLVTFITDSGINDVLSVEIVGSNYVVTDTATTISLTGAAKTAGWTGHGTNTVQGPVAGVTSFSFTTLNGDDTFTKLVTGVSTTISSTGMLTFAGPGPFNVTGNLNVSGPSTFTLQNPVTATGNVIVTGIADLVATAGSKVTGQVVTFGTSNAIGSSGTPVETQATDLNLGAGAGGIFVTESDGANLAATASGAGAISVTNLDGALNIVAAIVTGSGPISLLSGDELVIDAPIGSGTYTGTITLAANTDGTGAEGYLQTLNGNLLTLNNSSSAAGITVNTLGGGTGGATLGVGSIGGTTGGTLSVSAFGGSILWNNNYTLPADADGADNPNVLQARDVTLTTTGAASAVGTAAFPIQTNTFVATDGVSGGNTLTINAGSGGIYLWDWGAGDLTVNGATASGAGNIHIAAATAAGSNMWIAGNISTGSGSIELLSNDDMTLNDGVTIGGAGFSGTVFLSGNRDKGTTNQILKMNPTAAIVTSNTTAGAVRLEAYGDTGASPTTITLSNITAGDGGTIAIDAVPDTVDEAGRIIINAGTQLDAGATGTVSLSASRSTATGDVIGTSAAHVAVVAGNVLIFTENIGNVWVTESDGATLAGALGVTGTATVTATTGLLTVAQPLQSNGAAISLNASGVAVTGTLGDADTGAITINGALSGNGAIALGTGVLTLNQSTNSTYSGNITGTPDVSRIGSGKLTLSGVVDASGNFSTSVGTTVFDGTTTALAAVTSTATGTVAGSGTINSTVTTAGTLSPGSSAGNLTTGSISFATDGVVAIELLGTNVNQYDRLTVNGTVDLTGAKLTVSAPNALAGSSKFTIIDNDTNIDPVVGTFQGLLEGQSLTADGQTFTISYVGGDGNDVVLTRDAFVAPVVTTIDVNSGYGTIFATQRSRIINIVVNFASPVDATQFQTAGAVTLTRTQSYLPGTPVIDTTNGLIVTPSSGSTSSITLTFQDISNPGVIDNASLGDGYWRLAIPAASYQSPLNDPILRRLFGDFDANGVVEGAVDFPAFGADFNGSFTPPPGSPFDFNNDGVVEGSVDFPAFGANFNLTL